MTNTNRKPGRPVGSKNKKGTNGGVFITKFEKQVEGAAITKDSSMGWIRFGQANDYPNLLLNLYQNSPTHHAAINFEVQSIISGGIDYEAMKVDGSQIFPNYQYSYEQLIRNIALDYMLFGSYAIEVIRNKNGKDFSFYHIPYEKVRCSPYDKDGVITSYWISSDWTAIGQYPPFEIEAIDMRDESAIKIGKPYIYVYKNYDPSQTYYQSPFYAAGIKAIQAEISHCEYDLKTTVNGFTGAGMLVLNDVETSEERQAVINNIQKLFIGTNNANSVMVTFRNNVEESKPEWVPFTANSGNINLFDSAWQRTQSRILASHQIPSPSLCGLPDVGSTGFQSDSQKLETAYQLYQRLTGNYHRQAIVKSLNDMFKLNGIDVEIILKPLHFNDFGDENDVSNDVSSSDTNQDVSTDNVEEKKDGSNKSNEIGFTSNYLKN